MNSTQHEPPESAQAEELKVPEDVGAKFAVPDGTELIPLPVSRTTAVHLVLVFTGAASGEHLTLIADGRFVTWTAVLP